MDFDLTGEQQMLRDELSRFARGELNHDVVGRDGKSEFPADEWRKCAEWGIQGLPVPPEYGGQGTDALTIMLAMEALGYGCTDNGLIFSLNASMWTSEMPILRFGTEEQKQQYLPGLCDGSLVGAHGMSEPEAGSDIFSARDHRGRRTATAGCSTAARPGSRAPRWPTSSSASRRRTREGLRRALRLPRRPRHARLPGRPPDPQARRPHGSPMGELVLDDCELPADSPARPRGRRDAESSTARWSGSGAASWPAPWGHCSGSSSAASSTPASRKQFGQSIGKFQSVSHKIVDMKLRLETARCLVYRLGWLMSQGKATALDSALVKLHLSESFVSSSLDAVQIHGGYGYMAEYELERELRDAVGSRIYSGTSEIQRNMAAAHLGLGR